MTKKHIKELETKAIWRFIKIAYIVFALVAIISTVSSGFSNVSDCHEENNRVPGSGMAGKRLAYERSQNELSCNPGDVMNESIESTGIVIVLGVGMYFVIRRVSYYLIIGPSAKSKHDIA